jgi:hypothetical protein
VQYHHQAIHYEGAGKKYFDKFPNITWEAKITETLPKPYFLLTLTAWLLSYVCFNAGFDLVKVGFDLTKPYNNLLD